jgi:hypothetical protein
LPFASFERTGKGCPAPAAGPCASALSGGFRLAFAVAAGFSLLGVLAAVVLLSRRVASYPA